MLCELKLTNFKRHRDVELAFTEGLNIIRASNEFGKSTLFHAIGYAFWGARALPESLEETVTWGEPASSLKVRLKFTFDNTEYVIVRSKSGAELVGGNAVASGQAEVTAFVERLFGASRDVGAMTLISHQGALQQGLEGSAISLIEKLSNMGLIDDLVTKIAAVHPTGNTRISDARIAELSQIEMPVANFAETDAAVALASRALGAADLELSNAAQASRLREEPAIQANALIRRQAARDAATEVLQARQEFLQRKLGAGEPSEPTFTNSIEELESAALAQAGQFRVRFAWDRWQQLPEAVSHYPGGVGAFTEKAAQLRTAIKESNSELARFNTEMAVAKALEIQQDMCGLCGKDLKDVPEVVAANQKTSERLSELRELEAVTRASLEQQRTEMSELTAMDKLNSARLLVARSIEEFVKVDVSVIPNGVHWIGEAPTEPDNTDYKAALAQQRAASQAYELARASWANAQKELKEVVQTLWLRAAESEDVEEAASALEKYRDAKQLLQSCEVLQRKASESLTQATHAKELAERSFQREVQLYETLKAEQASLQQTVSKTLFYNRLIKRLREARPVVARELWSIVLSGVSQIFSHIRGEPSTVTRSNDKFLIDGKPASVFSGSTKDSLGLATRIMLQKTFLGGIDFLLLDEPAAALDSVRESDMLSAVTRAEFKQVLLVTHSDLADAYAANLISL